MKQISTEYYHAVQLIKAAILQNQLDAAKAVNQQMLALYYGVGKFVSENTRNGVWGTGAIETISEQLRRELPGLRGFSSANIKKMRIFYESWNNYINRSPMANDLDWHDFFALSFTHHMEIIFKTKTLEERKPHENPTIGIVLCRDADKTYVEYLLQDYSQPMGVATYDVIPEKLKKVLPPEEGLRKILKGESISD